MKEELSTLVQEYVEGSQSLIESLMSKKAYSVDEGRLKGLAENLNKVGLVPNTQVFVKEASAGPEILLDILDRVSCTSEKGAPLVKLGAPYKKRKERTGRMDVKEGDADRFILQHFGIRS